MIASIDLTTSPLISLVCESACSASVRTARSTASFASSVFGLNSCFSRRSNSLDSSAPAGACCSDFVSAITVLRSPQRLLRRFVLWFLCGGKGLQEGGILQQLAVEILRSALAVHVRNQVRELLPGLEQFVQGIRLARDGRRREVVHVLERQFHVEIAFAGQRVGQL